MTIFYRLVDGPAHYTVIMKRNKPNFLNQVWAWSYDLNWNSTQIKNYRMFDPDELDDFCTGGEFGNSNSNIGAYPTTPERQALYK